MAVNQETQMDLDLNILKKMFSVLPSPGPTLEPVMLITLVLLPLKFPLRHPSRTSFSRQLAVVQMGLCT